MPAPVRTPTRPIVPGGRQTLLTGPGVTVAGDEVLFLVTTGDASQAGLAYRDSAGEAGTRMLKAAPPQASDRPACATPAGHRRGG